MEGGLTGLVILPFPSSGDEIDPGGGGNPPAPPGLDDLVDLPAEGVPDAPVFFTFFCKSRHTRELKNF